MPLLFCPILSKLQVIIIKVDFYYTKNNDVWQGKVRLNVKWKMENYKCIIRAQYADSYWAPKTRCSSSVVRLAGFCLIAASSTAI